MRDLLLLCPTKIKFVEIVGNKRQNACLLLIILIERELLVLQGML
jgi:hypothetical protein